VLRGARARVALLTPEAEGPLGAALRALVDLEVFAPGPSQPLGALPLLSPRFDRVVSLIGNTPAHAHVLAAAARFGGAALIRDGCPLAAYGERSGVEGLAAAELGRAVGSAEVARWRRGEMRPPALLLGEIAAAAEPLMVHSRALAGRVRERYRTGTAVVPWPIAASVRQVKARALVEIGAAATGMAAEACVWAADMLRSWGVRVQLSLVGEERPELLALGRELGLEGRVRFVPALGAAISPSCSRCAGKAVSAACSRPSVRAVCHASRRLRWPRGSMRRPGSMPCRTSRARP
jgi:hypothetical protein